MIVCIWANWHSSSQILTLVTALLHDAIIVLGFNNDPDHPVFRARVEKAAALYHEGSAAQIIMSGCCSDKLDIRPKITEAAAMCDYAMELDVPGAVILLEEDSVDTLGNFYFSKKNILLSCSWYNVGIVSTPWHVFRSEWLAAQVLGPDFDVTGYPSANPSGWGDEEVSKSEQYNKELLATTQAQLGHLTPGDHESIATFLGIAPVQTSTD